MPFGWVVFPSYFRQELCERKCIIYFWSMVNLTCWQIHYMRYTYVSDVVKALLNYEVIIVERTIPVYD